MAKVIFVQEIWFPFESVMLLSANLKKAGHKTAVAVGKIDKAMKEIKEYNPDIIAFSLLTSYRKFMFNVTNRLRKEGINVPIIVGGYDATFTPQMIEKAQINALCLGEGDNAIVEFVNAVEKGEDYSKIKNLWVKKDSKIIKNDIMPFVDVNKRQWNDREIYRNYDSYFQDIEFEQVMVGRGCPYQCSYCFNHKYREFYFPVSKKYCDLRNPDNVIDECVMLRDKNKVKTIFFNDSTLGYNKQWMRELFEKYRQRVDLPFSINATFKEINEEFCKIIAETKKCYIIRVGLETGNEKLRDNVLNKHISNEEMLIAAKLLQKYKIRYSMAVMFGLPTETLANSFETLDRAIELSGKNTVVAVNIFKPFPKLNITEYGVEKGVYKRELIEDTNLIGDNVMNFFECFREDEEGKKILQLSRLSQLYLHFPLLRKIIKNKLIHKRDNKLFRTIWKFSDYYYTSRHHINASIPFLLKYIIKHSRKGVRG